MKLPPNMDKKEILKLMRRKYRYQSEAVFQFFCVNEALQTDERYKELYEDLYDFFLERANIVTEATDFAGSDLIFIAQLQYKYGQTHGITVDMEYLDRYLLEYPYKKDLLVNNDVVEKYYG